MEQTEGVASKIYLPKQYCKNVITCNTKTLTSYFSPDCLLGFSFCEVMFDSVEGPVQIFNILADKKQKDHFIYEPFPYLPLH